MKMKKKKGFKIDKDKFVKFLKQFGTVIFNRKILNFKEENLKKN